MRVTKTIREYIEERVAIALPKPVEIQQYNDFREQVEEVKEKLNTKIEETISALKETMGEEYIDIIKPCAYYNAFVSDCRKSPLYEISYEKEREWKAKKEKTVRDIVIQLELGANREELENMLRNIH